MPFWPRPAPSDPEGGGSSNAIRVIIISDKGFVWISEICFCSHVELSIYELGKKHLNNVSEDRRGMVCATLDFGNTWKIFSRPFVVLLDLDKNTVTACCLLHILCLNEMAILFRILYYTAREHLNDMAVLFGILYRYNQITPE